MGLTSSTLTGTFPSSHCVQSSDLKCLTSWGKARKLNDFARVDASIPPCSMLRMIDLSRTRTCVASTFCTILRKSDAVVSVVTFVSSFLALSLLLGSGTRWWA